MLAVLGGVASARHVDDTSDVCTAWQQRHHALGNMCWCARVLIILCCGASDNYVRLYVRTNGGDASLKVSGSWCSDGIAIAMELVIATSTDQ